LAALRFDRHRLRLGSLLFGQRYGRLPGTVFRPSLRPIQGGIPLLFRPELVRERPPVFAALTLLLGLLPALPASVQAAPLAGVIPRPVAAVSPVVAAPVLPPPLGAAALLGPEPLSLGGDASPGPAPPALMAPAALEGPGGASTPGPAAALSPTPPPISPSVPAGPSPVGSPVPSASPAAAPTATVLPPAISPTPLGATPSPVATDRALVLDRQRRLLSMWENGRLVRRFPVAVGMPGWETPVGRFQVLNKTENPVWEHPQKGTHTPAGPANPLGSRWIGFHQDCQGRRGWDGEHMLDVKGCVVAGFHGTPHRWTVGQALSHGCVRLYDEDVRQVFDFVLIGTPVTVLP